MASQVLPEHWSELNAARSQRKFCVADVDKLKSSCARDCGKKHVTECKACYGRVLDRMRKRYSESKEKEWFSQRRAFLQELDDLFADAKDNNGSLQAIEAHIESEKEAWYRWVLRRHPDFLEVAEHDAPIEEMRGMLGDPDRSREELVAMMWQGVGMPDDWSEKVEEFVEKVLALKDKPEELKKLYIAEIFKSPDGERVLEHAQPYLDEYQASDSLTLEQVIGHIVEDHHRSRSSQPQRDTHASRLNELRRAKTAFERKRKESKALLREAQAKSVLYDLPPCAACQRAVSSEDIFSCSLCQAIVQMGGGGQLTVYCSENCLEKGQQEHVGKQHDCNAGEKCIQLTDEDTEMTDDTTQAMLCKQCIEGNRATVYCSQRCASERLAAHMQEVHGNATVAGATSAAVAISEIVELTLARENPTLKIERVQ
ncbi:Zinc finger, MYND-type [Cordyceps fumosorosea ARSEF 2679]|uniref:Zinc finger, MYND-type n=1 Tax=Cordyceps fumosorosea (strain ARSEF 2679) TaxID=1081104 RepID=A0A167SVV2_CORFA|nr:Zinc finger, MYND-type [Cordyceps fumosorosea ARSEF 2679]OAA59977.1 Zinc finger, MYND-type [Cordyceps fumosorosea ARSEF 2679]